MLVTIQFTTNVIVMISVHLVQSSPQSCVWAVMNYVEIFIVILMMSHVECLAIKLFHVFNTDVKRLAIKDHAKQKVNHAISLARMYGLPVVILVMCPAIQAQNAQEWHANHRYQ